MTDRWHIALRAGRAVQISIVHPTCSISTDSQCNNCRSEDAEDRRVSRWTIEEADDHEIGYTAPDISVPSGVFVSCNMQPLYVFFK